MKTISAIPIFRMDNYVGEMRRRLAEKQIGAKRQFLRKLLNEVRVRGSNITPTFKLALAASECRFFTPGEAISHRSQWLTAHLMCTDLIVVL
jgi:hypothetical protein